jgi:hypothetical protein
MKGADVIWTIVILALVSTATAALAAVLSPSPAAPARRGAVRLPATCTDPLTSDQVAGTVELVGFTGDYGRIQAVLRLTNGVTGHSTHVLVGVDPTRERRRGREAIVSVTTEPTNQFRVGLHVRTDAIRLVPRARQGTVVADVASALGFASPRSEARALNRLLSQAMIHVA